MWELIKSTTHLGNLKNNIKYVGILAIQVLMRISLPAWDNNFPLHPAILLIILSIKGWRSSLLVCGNARECLSI
jgi:hypothetical protein